MIRKHLRFRRRIFVGLAFAALSVAPAAQATTGFYVDGGPAPRSESSATSSSYLRYHQYNPVELIAPNATPITSENSAQPLSRLQVEAMRLQAIADAYQSLAPVRSENSSGAGGPNSIHATAPQMSASVSASSDPFSWNDAGIGASVAFGAALLLLISVFMGRRNRDRTGLASA